MKEETFKMGQRVVFREDWLKKHQREASREQMDRMDKWLKLPHLTVIQIVNHDATAVKLATAGYDGTWTNDAITAYQPPPLLDEDLFHV